VASGCSRLDSEIVGPYGMFDYRLGKPQQV